MYIPTLLRPVKRQSGERFQDVREADNGIASEIGHQAYFDGLPQFAVKETRVETGSTTVLHEKSDEVARSATTLRHSTASDHVKDNRRQIAAEALLQHKVEGLTAVTNRRHGQDQAPMNVNPMVASRKSYVVKTGQRIQRRNRRQIKLTQEKKRDEEQIEIEPPEIEPPVDGNAETQGGADFTKGTQMTRSPNPSPSSAKEIGC